MKLSIKWLSDWVEMNQPIEQYIEDMTMSGSKVEAVEHEDAVIKNVVVGKVLSVTPHNNADTLVICQVDIGEAEPVQIVTGATNVNAGDIVPVAKHKSVLANGTEITKGKLRGEESHGMLCSLSELGLTKGDFPEADEDGIFILNTDAKVGSLITEAIGLNDTVVEFEITSNRPDCLSVMGMARETAATYGSKLKTKEISIVGNGAPVESLLSLEVKNNILCQRYVATVVENVKIESSPQWMRERLRASGVRPINNIVDITNYVMLEYGHPMHAFDLRHVNGNKIVVRHANPNETITTLDGTLRKLSEEMLVIADSEKASAVAGVMGGEYSGVYDDTTTIIFESACFNGPSVRRTAKALGMRTESSGRFEKGLDPQNCMPAIQRACELVELLGAGTVTAGFLDSNSEVPELNTITFDPDWVREFIGADISTEEMITALESLGFSLKGDTVYVPSFRANDVILTVDLAEEIARIYGYNKIPTTPLRGAVRGTVSVGQLFRHRVEKALYASGVSEIQTYSFFSPKQYNNIMLAEDSPLRDSVVISNPLGEDTSVMRTTALPSMLQVLSSNYNNRTQSVNLYEIATEYRNIKGEMLPNELKHIVIGCYGTNYDFYTLKGIVVNLFKEIGIKNADFNSISDDPSYHPGRCASIVVNGVDCGTMGEIHPLVSDNYDIKARVYAAYLDYEALFANADPEPTFTPLPRYPASTRDLALVCSENTPVGAIEKVLRESIGAILEKVELFDIYRGAQLGENNKSVAYSLTLRSKDHTLTDEDSENVVNKGLVALEKIGISLRK